MKKSVQYEWKWSDVKVYFGKMIEEFWKRWIWTLEDVEMSEEIVE